MSFILDALKKVDRKNDDQAKDGVVMQGGRVWGESRWTGRWAWGTVLVLAVVTCGLAAFALLRSLQSKPGEAAVVASEPQSESRAVVSSASPSGSSAEGTVVPSDSGVRSGESTSVAGVVEPSRTLPEAPAVEGEVLAELIPPVRLVGRGAADRTRQGSEREAEEDLPADLPALALQGTSVIDGEPVAVVNYQRVFEGDFIEGAKVIKILDRTVELEFKGTRFTIRL